MFCLGHDLCTTPLPTFPSFALVYSLFDANGLCYFCLYTPGTSRLPTCRVSGRLARLALTLSPEQQETFVAVALSGDEGRRRDAETLIIKDASEDAIPSWAAGVVKDLTVAAAGSAYVELSDVDCSAFMQLRPKVRLTIIAGAILEAEHLSGDAALSPTALEAVVSVNDVPLVLRTCRSLATPVTIREPTIEDHTHVTALLAPGVCRDMGRRLAAETAHHCRNIVQYGLGVQEAFLFWFLDGKEALDLVPAFFRHRSTGAASDGEHWKAAEAWAMHVAPLLPHILPQCRTEVHPPRLTAERSMSVPRLHLYSDTPMFLLLTWNREFEEEAYMYATQLLKLRLLKEGLGDRVESILVTQCRAKLAAVKTATPPFPVGADAPFSPVLEHSGDDGRLVSNSGVSSSISDDGDDKLWSRLQEKNAEFAKRHSELGPLNAAQYMEELLRFDKELYYSMVGRD